MLWLGHADRSKALTVGRRSAVVEAERVLVFHVERDRAERPGHLDSQGVPAADRHAARLEGGQNAAVEASREEGDIVDGHSAALARSGYRPVVDEGFEDAADTG